MRYPWWQSLQIIVLICCLVAWPDLSFCSKTKREKLHSIFSFLFLSQRRSPKNAKIFLKKHVFLQSLLLSAINPLTSGCAFHFLQCLRGSECIQRASFVREVSAGHLWNFQVLGKDGLKNVELSPLHTSVFLVWIVIHAKHYILVVINIMNTRLLLVPLHLMLEVITSSPSCLMHCWALVLT